MDQREYCDSPLGMNSFPPYRHPGSNLQHQVMLPPYNHQMDNLHGNQRKPVQMMFMPSVLPSTSDVNPFWVRNDYFDYPYQQNSPMMGYQHVASPVVQFTYPTPLSYDLPQPFPVPYQSKSSAVSSPEVGKNLNEAEKKQEMSEEKKEKKSVPILVGRRRRGGRILPTGVIKNQRTEKKRQLNGGSDEWSNYVTEVRRYKEKYGEEDRTCSLVK